jgi:hypothetical protein
LQISCLTLVKDDTRTLILLRPKIWILNFTVRSNPNCPRFETQEWREPWTEHKLTTASWICNTFGQFLPFWNEQSQQSILVWGQTPSTKSGPGATFTIYESLVDRLKIEGIEVNWFAKRTPIAAVKSD